MQKKVWVLACCDDDGKCIGFLGHNNELVDRPIEFTKEHIKSFKTKKETNELCMQINLSHALMPSRLNFPYRVTPCHSYLD